MYAICALSNYLAVWFASYHYVGAQEAAGTEDKRTGDKAGNGKDVTGEGTADQRQTTEVCSNTIAIHARGKCYYDNTVIMNMI